MEPAYTIFVARSYFLNKHDEVPNVRCAVGAYGSPAGASGSYIDGASVPWGHVGISLTHSCGGHVCICEACLSLFLSASSFCLRTVLSLFSSGVVVFVLGKGDRSGGAPPARPLSLARSERFTCTMGRRMPSYSNEKLSDIGIRKCI